LQAVEQQAWTSTRHDGFRSSGSEIDAVQVAPSRLLDEKVDNFLTSQRRRGILFQKGAAGSAYIFQWPDASVVAGGTDSEMAP
jgi:hypothetical protein